MAYSDDDVANMAAQGRRASYNSMGQVRGFRTRPGAPMADPTRNVGSVGSTLSGFTPKSNWDSLFRNRLTGSNPLSPESKTPTPSQTAPAGDAWQDDSLDSLITMASGGMNHAQQWSQPKQKTGWQITSPDEQLGIRAQYGGQSGDYGFGWGSAFKNYG